MATARVIHHENDEDLNPQPITISSSGVSPQACIIANGQSVAFSSSGPTVNITFEADAFGVVVFNNVSGLSPTNPNTQPPQVNNRTVNYNIDGSSVYPYAIAVGGGPMYVKVTAGNTTPDPVVIPLNSSIEMISTDQNYSVNWFTSNGDPFTPPLTEIYTSGNPLTKPHTNNRPVADYGYRISPVETPGGGTVKVKST
jgi:hypothetical protein